MYSKDAYIISYLFKYKIKENEKVPTCSFPLSSLSKVENILEKYKINYLVVDKRSNYDVEHQVINKQENNYNKVFEVAKVKLLDFFVNISYDKKIINQKKYLKVGQRLDDVIKYVTGWLNATNESIKKDTSK